MTTWMTAKVHAIRHWHAGLFSLQVDVKGFNFKAGQFARLGLPATKDIIPAGPPEPRAYSMVNAPGQDILEFVIAKVPEGEVTPHLQNLVAGDDILINSHPSGFFTLDHVPDGDTLWMLATGTGIGPYLSILQQDEIWQRYPKVRLVHGVRTHADLCYRDWLKTMVEQRPQQFAYHAVVSRESQADPAVLQGRIPTLIASGELEHAADAVLNPQSQVMLCGNPAMIQDARQALADKGLQKHLKRKPGQITMEQYWAD